MNSTTKPTTPKPAVLDAATIEAVARKLKADEAAEEEQAALADLRSRDFLDAPARFVYLGPPRRLGQELARLSSTFSRTPAPKTTAEDHLVAGCILDRGIGDRDPVAFAAANGYPAQYRRLEGEEAAQAFPIQSALAIREVKRPMDAALGVHEAAVKELGKRQAECAEANRRRDEAEKILGVAITNRDREVSKFTSFCSSISPDAEARADAVLAALNAPQEPAENRGRVSVPPPPEPRAQAEQRGTPIVAQA
jgi:hypothetical protein